MNVIECGFLYLCQMCIFIVYSVELRSSSSMNYTYMLVAVNYVGLQFDFEFLYHYYQCML
jgi:hypothetical protein